MSKLFRILLCVILGLAVLLPAGIPVLAEESHENPDTAITVFSGIALFSYFSNTLDDLLQKNPAEVEMRMQKLPFANIPENIKSSVDDFAAVLPDIAKMIVDVDEEIGQLAQLVQQSRFDETIEMSLEIYIMINAGKGQLNLAQSAVEETGSLLKIQSVSETPLLKLQYAEVIGKLGEISNLLDAYENYILQLLAGLKGIDDITGELPAEMSLDKFQEFLEELDTKLMESLSPVKVTLEIEAQGYFVGETVDFYGILTLDGKPLAGKEVAILEGGSPVASALTDSNGFYLGSFQLPFDYVSVKEMRSLYSPKGQDIGLYLAGMSPVVFLDVLFYDAELKMILEDKAYPGYDTDISGRFLYGEDPIPENQREIEIYIDDVLVAETSAGEIFSETVSLSSTISVGIHTVILSVQARGRYAPVLETATLRVTRITPVLELDIPDTAMIPGSFDLSGRLYSNLGPLRNAAIEIQFGSYTKQTTSTDEGLINTRVGTGLAFGLIGSQDMVIQVIPTEPYYTSLVDTRNVLLINLISSIVILIVILLLGIYLPGRIKRRLAVYRQRRADVFIPVTETVMLAGVSKTTAEYSRGREEDLPDEPREKILTWYVWVIRAVQKISNVFLTPQHTLREFANDTSGYLGPASKYFRGLTRTAERLIYSRYNPTAADVSSSEQYYQGIEDESVSVISDEKIVLESNDDSLVIDTVLTGNKIAEELRDRLSESQLSIQFSTWLLVVLMLAVIYYVAVIVLIIPLFMTALACGLPVVIVDEADQSSGKDEKIGVSSL